MGSNTIRRGLVLRAAFFAASLSGTLLLFIYTQWVVTPVLLGIVTLFAVISLIRYAERSERNFQSFLHAIRYKDYTYLQTMSRRKAHVHYRMLFEEVMDEFRKLKAERESHHESMQLVLQQLEAGVICFERESGKILFINPAALEIFGKPHITHFYTLEHSRPELFAGVSALQPGKPDVLSAVVREKISTLAAHVKDFRMLNTDMRLIILQNIKNELDNQEILSWQKLISVLTHEIMNSTTPVISLSEVVASGLSEEKIRQLRSGELPEEELEELRLSVAIIRNRSQNLVKFVQTYRTLTKIPQPDKKVIDLRLVCMHTGRLFGPQFQQEGVRFHTQLPETACMAYVDIALIEQVVINLVKNALEAVRKRADAEIVIRLFEKNDACYIEVEDNGPGISPAYLEQIFVPFFTTKMQGSGIGLSLSRQIMRLHGGNVYVKTVEGQGSIFTLEFS